MSTELSPTPYNFRSFIIPARHPASRFDYSTTRVCAIIPTFLPSEITLKLVRDLVRWNKDLLVYVVDDCSPEEHIESARLLRRIASVSYHRVILLRTPTNKLKAGALNHALAYIGNTETEQPHVGLTLDGDVVIAETTVETVVAELMRFPHLGAVCSECRVYNKNTNLLTRLQGLEYLGFNAIRLADQGFLRGPLVMHGMLTAFRGSALRAVGGFMEGHLIEDYEVTTRLKELGWSVRSAQNAPAWTVVPATIPRLWRQRTRWSYGGITVVAKATSRLSVFQDILGHTVFLSTLLMVAVLYFSQGSGIVPPLIAELIIALSLMQLFIWYSFQLWLMRGYAERDALDWLIRATLVPELAYGYLTTFALLGSYFFHLFSSLKRLVEKGGGSMMRTLFEWGSDVFRVCGYAERSWGNRRKSLI